MTYSFLNLSIFSQAASVQNPHNLPMPHIPSVSLIVFKISQSFSSLYVPKSKWPAAFFNLFNSYLAVPVSLIISKFQMSYKIKMAPGQH